MTGRLGGVVTLLPTVAHVVAFAVLCGAGVVWLLWLARRAGPTHPIAPDAARFAGLAAFGCGVVNTMLRYALAVDLRYGPSATLVALKWLVGGLLFNALLLLAFTFVFFGGSLSARLRLRAAFWGALVAVMLDVVIFTVLDRHSPIHAPPDIHTDAPVPTLPPPPPVFRQP